MQVRASGILMHITSLPSPYGIGDLGPEAFRFADYLAALGQRYWQILPLSPTSPAMGNSPYSSASAFAANPLLISPEVLAQGCCLPREDILPFPAHNPRWAEYELAANYKQELLLRAFAHQRRLLPDDPDFNDFAAEQAFWLDDYALFSTLKARFNGALWTEWPAEFRDRDPDALEGWRCQAEEALLFERFVQYHCHRQWLALKRYANAQGLSMVGDMPIYVTLDSADVWAAPQIFKLGPDRRPLCVAGVPPDYFSETGQLWGNPVYDWPVLKQRGYDWWLRRMEHAFRLFDSVRLDHFRAFAQYWEVPADEQTAINGTWVDGPGSHFFETLLRRMPGLSLIAEDLGLITADVRELKDRFRFPGMVILLFCFGPNLPENPYTPHNHCRNSIVYTGTHDNNTCNGWYYGEASPEERQRLLRYAAAESDGGNAHLLCVRLAMSSVARTAIFPLQDVLGLGQDTRMNTPSTTQANWVWRVLPEELSPERARAFHDLARLYGRA